MISRDGITHLPLYYSKPFCKPWVQASQNHFPSAFLYEVAFSPIRVEFKTHGALSVTSESDEVVLGDLLPICPNQCLQPPASFVLLGFCVTGRMEMSGVRAGSGFGGHAFKLVRDNVRDGECSLNSCFLVASSHLLENANQEKGEKQDSVRYVFGAFLASEAPVA